MASSSAEHASHHDPEEHERHYKKVWLILVVLLIASVAGPLIADMIWEDHANTMRLIVVLLTAFGIALVKAFYVVRDFMHLNMEPKYVLYLTTTALAFMGLLFFFVAPDVMNHQGTNWINEAAIAATTGGVGHGGEEAFDAAAAFAGTCAPCHGAAGRGDGAAAAALNPRPANFTDAAFWAGRDREEITTAIRDGGAAVGRSATMAAFGAAFPGEKLEQLVDFVMAFRPEGVEAPAPDAPAPAPTPTPAPVAVPSPAPAPPPGISAEEQAQRADFIRARVLERLDHP